MSQHPGDYLSWLSGTVPNSVAVKHFIAENIFLLYVGRAAEVVLFLLATMTIVEILDNNGCFDFIAPILRTRKSRKYLWLITLVTFVISANLDNITTTTMMLVVKIDNNWLAVTYRTVLMLLFAGVIIKREHMGGMFTRILARIPGLNRLVK